MKKQDLQGLAKKLCREAGFDPFEIVERPGLKDAPRWIGYMDAADKKLNAVPGPMPQPKEYAGAHIEVVGSHEDVTISQMKTCMEVGNVVAGVICADGHLGYAQPVGCVIAYEKQISISGVGFDIGCGNYAVKLDTKYTDVQDKIPLILGDIRRIISFGVGRTNAETVGHELFDDADAWRMSDMEEYRQKAVSQLGTVGSGIKMGDTIILHRDDGSGVPFFRVEGKTFNSDCIYLSSVRPIIPLKTEAEKRGAKFGTMGVVKATGTRWVFSCETCGMWKGINDKGIVVTGDPSSFRLDHEPEYKEIPFSEATDEQRMDHESVNFEGYSLSQVLKTHSGAYILQPRSFMRPIIIDDIYNTTATVRVPA